MIVENDSDALSVDGPDLLVLVHIAVQTQHIEEHIDR